ncbi:MAG: tetratricopeptide repeat protein [Pseudomonadota bacterium]
MPLLAMSAACSVLTYAAQFEYNAVISLEALPMKLRTLNVAVSYLQYLKKTLWPVDLAIFYPLLLLDLWKALASAFVVVAISGLVIWQAFRKPFLPVGWFWFIGTLVPVIGLVQVGSQSMADRYTYLPSIGLFIVIVWGWNAVLGGIDKRRRVSILCTLIVLPCLGLLTWKQTGYWHDTQSLFEHAASVNNNSHMVHSVLGGALLEKGELDQAIEECRQALKINPSSADAHNTIGSILARRKQYEEATSRFDEALRINPKHLIAHLEKGSALAQMGKIEEADLEFTIVAELMERDGSVYLNSGICNIVGIAFANIGKNDKAIAQLYRAIDLAPQSAVTHNNIGKVLTSIGNTDEAISALEQAIKLKPCYAEAFNNLGLVYMQVGNYDDAIVNFAVAFNCKPDYTNAVKNFQAGLKALCGQEQGETKK